MNSGGEHNSPQAVPDFGARRDKTSEADNAGTSIFRCLCQDPKSHLGSIANASGAVLTLSKWLELGQLP